MIDWFKLLDLLTGFFHRSSGETSQISTQPIMGGSNLLGRNADQRNAVLATHHAAVRLTIVGHQLFAGASTA